MPPVGGKRVILVVGLLDSAIFAYVEPEIRDVRFCHENCD